LRLGRRSLCNRGHWKKSRDQRGEKSKLKFHAV